MVFLGIVFVVILFFLAKSINLRLTLEILQYFIGVSAIVLVIIFQLEIRKYFELLGLIGTRRIKINHDIEEHSPTAEILQACVKMTKKKIGALIVIQGVYNIDPFTGGGVLLDGLVSEEVILSIFDPASEGHDGALVIGNNRIIKFATHLPLTMNFKELGKRGTRHSAALGLSEHSDALCIVVSEEKGTISICRNGKLKVLDEYEDLERELIKYAQHKIVKGSDGIILYTMKHNILLKSISIALAGLIWFLFA